MVFKVPILENNHVRKMRVLPDSFPKDSASRFQIVVCRAGTPGPCQAFFLPIRAQLCGFV